MLTHHKQFLLHSPKSDFVAGGQATILYNEFENQTF